MRSDSNLRERFAAEGVDTRDYGSMPGVLDTNNRVEGRGRVLRSHSFSGRETNSLFFNESGEAFADRSALSGADSIADGRGFAYLDYDRDGWIDIALTNSNAPQLELFRNRLGELGSTGRSIRVRLIGAHDSAAPAPGAGRTARDGAGAHVVARAGALSLRREARIGDGFAAQNSATLTIGIGPAQRAEEVTVHWPSGRTTEAGRVPAGALLTVREKAGGGTGDGAIGPKEIEITMPERAVLPRSAGPPLGIEALDFPLPASGAKLRVITTMATWCAVCRGELPQLADLRAGLNEEQVSLLGFPIDPEETPAALTTYRQEQQPAYTMLTETTGAHKDAMNKLLIKHLGEAVLPATVVVDARGSVIRIRKGVPTLSEIRRLLKQVP